jgi:hypothetical protein
MIHRISNLCIFKSITLTIRIDIRKEPETHQVSHVTHQVAAVLLQNGDAGKEFLCV